MSEQSELVHATEVIGNAATAVINPSTATRVVVVLNKQLEPGIALNAAAHLAAGICNHIGEPGREKLNFINFVDADSGSHPSISACSLIVLRGTSAEIRTLRVRLAEAHIPAVDFTRSMTGDTWVEQLARSANTREAELDYFGLAAFGTRESLAPFTKKFSLYK